MKSSGMSEHTKGRLEAVIREGTPLACVVIESKPIADLYGGRDMKPGEQAANARRLVACWNSWEGVSTKAIEDATAKVSPITYGQLERDRAELIEALREQREYLKRLKHRADVRGGPDVSAMGIADEAIAAIDAAVGKHAPKVTE